MKRIFLTIMLLQFAAASPRALGAAEEIPLKEDGSWTHARPSFGTAGADAAASPAQTAGLRLIGGGPDGESIHGGAPRSPAREAAMSFLLPGLGQYRMGNRTRAKIYFGLEGAGWIAAGAFFWQSMVRRDEYEEYAVAYAGVPGTGLDEDYYEKIGDFISSDGPGGYNESVLIEARNLYYPDKAAMDAYYEENMIEGDLAWRWETEKSYHNFKDLFAGSDASRRRAVYAVFFILGLRAVSMVDALKIARDSNGEAGGETGMRLDMEPCVDGVRVSLCRRF
ncbi:MAG: hypothetical protein MUF59_04255 [Candidatus Krumholzibacteria bacterium]|nr:hypothetical protein [Candidatus Krumholzibacteria bacterium]